MFGRILFFIHISDKLKAKPNIQPQRDRAYKIRHISVRFVAFCQ